MLDKKDGIDYHPIDEKFTYTLHDGTVITFPYVENLEYGIIEDASNQPTRLIEAFLFDTLVGKNAEKIRRKMTLREYRELFARWQEESALTLGE